MKRKLKSNKKTISRIIDVSIIALVAVTIFWLVSLGIKINSGVAKTIPVPDHYIRLQLLDGGAGSHTIEVIKDKLDGYSDDNIEIAVVDTDRFRTKKIKHSFLINRSEKQKAVEHIAELLGLDSDDVARKELEANTKYISMTLVAGIDADATILATIEKRSEDELP